MKPLMRSFAQLSAALVLAVMVMGTARADGSSDVVEVAFDATFDTEGRLTELKPFNEAEQSPALWDNLKSRLGAMKLPPVKTEDGLPARFRTGMYVGLEVVRGGEKAGQVRIKGLHPGPLVLVKDMWAAPKDVSRSAGWDGQVEVECTVGVEGQCGEVKVNTVPGMPPSVVRWAKATLGLWRFQPPEINGQPISAPFRRTLTLQIRDDMPTDFRDKRKL